MLSDAGDQAHRGAEGEVPSDGDGARVDADARLHGSDRALPQKLVAPQGFSLAFAFSIYLLSDCHLVSVPLSPQEWPPWSKSFLLPSQKFTDIS